MKLIKLLSDDWIKGKDISVACLSSATNSVYLVFDELQLSPRLAIKLADNQEVNLKAFDILKQLYNAVGDLVSKPIAKVEHKNKTYVIESGLAGRPWFQISHQYDSEESRAMLRIKALDALNRLQIGIQSIAEWTSLYSAGDELRNTYELCCELGVELPSESEYAVAEMSKVLDQLDKKKSWCQHGDFCLNNLIIEADDIHIIDFEDFGITSMPFYDEISLGLSMYLSAPPQITTSIQTEILACVLPSLKARGIDEEALPGFYLHHSLIRLGEWSLGDKRKEYRLRLLDLLEDYLRNPREYFFKNDFA